ncbi:MAG: nucleotidyl transferase, partial [bacterium]|nr:nucleotidyl transferase [bacterium]
KFVGIYYFVDGRLLYQCLDELIESGATTKGEYQLTDALQKMLERGARMKPFVIDDWYDCGKPETLLATNRVLLARRNSTMEAIKAHNFKGSLIKPPVSIGHQVTIEESIVGPYVTVADGVTIRHSIIRNSILSRDATVENMLLDGSIIADNAKASGQSYTLNVGDSSEIRLG